MYAGEFAVHLHSTVNLSKIAVGHQLRRLVADTNLETSWAPVDKLNSPLRLDARNSRVDLLGDNVSAVQQAGGHVFPVSGVTLDHLVMGFEARVGDLLDRVCFVGCLGRRDNRGVRDKREVDAGVRDQVGLKLVQIHVERSVETKGGSNRRNNYTH